MEGFTGIKPQQKKEKLPLLRLTYDEFAGRAFSLYIILNISNIAVSLFAEHLSGNLLTLILSIIFLLYLVVHNKYMVRVLKKTVLLYFVFFVIAVFAFLSDHIESSQLISRYYWLYLYGIPLFGIFFNVKDTNVVVKNSERCLCFVEGVVLLTIVISAGRGIKGDYSMALGYAILYPTLLLMQWLKIRKRILLAIILLTINVFVIVSYGSRGQILCIALFILLYIMFESRKLTSKKALLIGAIVLGGLMVLLNIENILRFAIDILGHFGIYSRSLGYFLERAHYTGREVVWSAAIQNIQERPYFGWGIGVDVSQPGFYPHNLFLELLLHYGLIIGGIVVVYIIMLLFDNLVMHRDGSGLTIMLCCYGFVPLMLTSEYLLWPAFWAFIGLCIGRKKRVIQYEENRYENSWCNYGI